MDKQSILGFVLIALVIMVWMWFSTPKPQPVSHTNAQSSSRVQSKDSAETLRQQRERGSVNSAPGSQGIADSTRRASGAADSLGKYFADAARGVERTITIETDKYTAVFSTKGGVIKKWTLKHYKTWDQYPVQLVEDTKGGDFSLLFNTDDGKQINTSGLYFTTNAPGDHIVLSGSEERTIDFTLPVGSPGGGSIVKRFTFKGERYGLDVELRMVNMQSVLANYEYQVVWEHGIRFAEHNSYDEAKSALAYSYAGGELTEIDASKEGETPTSNTSGSTDWVAARTKYFAVALLSADKKATGAYLEGRHIPYPDGGVVKQYGIALKIPFKNSADETTKLSLYLGPLEYQTIKAYNADLEKIINLGWTWIRPITMFLFIPFFTMLHTFISNYGLVIIVFSIVIKLLLHPLTKKSLDSMRKMQKLAPIMEEIKVKYKDDPNAMNMQTMKLYKDYGVNPAGGCLPMLLQMPILFALYALFASAIELRQAPFVWWIKDLSIPDVMISLPFSIPLLGNFLSGLTLAMGVTMFVQQKMTTTDPRQAQMVWMMPIMFTIMFNNLPSGLNLYYFVFNLLSIGQQYYVNKKHGDEPLQKVTPKKGGKEGWMERMAKQLPQQPKK
ncbi:MAG TPA: membrane protein insertase YidC [Bacteroidota bacterium]|nr:membrane protein insertase YidC [Bacteroidota bacterium]